MVPELRADLARYPGGGIASLAIALRCAGFYAVAVYRFGYDVYNRWPRWLAPLGKIAYKPISLLCEAATGIALDPSARIGPGLYIGHWGCIRVGPLTAIGANCNLSPMVVLGVGVLRGKSGSPAIGDRVYIASGAKIFGPIRIGNSVAIGANAVVCRDVPDHVSVGGVPAKIISNRGSQAYLTVGQPLEFGGVDADEDLVEIVQEPDTPLPRWRSS